MLPYLLAGQAIEQILSQIDQRASALAMQVKLQPARSKRSTLPDLALIEQLLWNEQARFQRYTARWQQSLASLEGIEQLFIVS